MRTTKRASPAANAILSHGVRITSPDRRPYPQAKVSKRELVAYYENVSAVMLPHIAGRPLTLIRCPRGVDAPCFVQQHAAPGLPEAIRTVSLTEASGETGAHLYVDDLAGILACVQLGALELHGWGARASALEEPDRLVFDLDPDPSVPFRAVVDAALLIRDHLLEDGLTSWPMLSGGKGVHVVVPLTGATWPAASAWAKRLAQSLEKQAPDRFTSAMAKAERAGRIFIDYLRNERGATAVMPYSTRAKAGASISMPLSWEELARAPSAQAYTVHDVLTNGLPQMPGLGIEQRLPTQME
ncbi:non-homologous end-joining DNA ligase [Methylobacterium oryzisoli]|uniref:non-homologous end-joining DNA ligase n=1 Tax=Methylobacterium oryzisoli TaxID=3385502 RepID=UPI00389143A9